MKKFDKKVRWEFKVNCFGYGRNVKEALYAAAEHLQWQIDNEFDSGDLEKIENHEVAYVDESDFEPNEELNKLTFKEWHKEFQELKNERHN